MLFNYLLLPIALINFLLGLVSFLRNSRKRVNLYFFGLTIGLAIWCLGMNFFRIASAENSYLWGSVVYLGVSIALISFLLFSFVFPSGEIPRRLIFWIPFSVSSLYVLVVSVWPRGVFSLIVGDGLQRELHFNGGFYAHSAVTIVFFLFSFYNLLKKHNRASGITKVQLKYFYLGALLTCLTGLFFNALLPSIGNANLNWIGPAGTTFLVGFTSYAIVKHRMMDIRMVVARSVAYTLLVAAMAGFYAGAVLGIERIFFDVNELDLAQGALRTVLAVIMAFSFQPLKKWITNATDKFFFKNQYDAEAFLDTLAHTIGSTIVLIELIFKTLTLVRERMRITRGMMVLLTDGGSVYNSQTFGYGQMPKINAEDMVRLAKDGILVYDELEDSSRYKKLLKKYDVSVSVPLKTENDTQGVLLLGEKLSGDMFNQKDLKVFEIIAPELAVAITNAKAFEKIDKFNVTLRQEIKKATSELEQKNEQLRELDKAKDEFISMASHQLRTPLTAIKGYLSMLLEGDAGEIKVSQYDFVNEAFQGANRMVGLINDLLNVSRMETGRFFLEPTEVDLDIVVQEEIKQLQNHAKEKKLYLKYQKKGKVPKVWADETKIRQVVMNFMDNALYYTTDGGVTITLESDGKNVVYKVSDTGIGVPKEQQKNLFTKFYRADNARHVRPDGTGLGIYLAKKVMDDHGGSLIFHSVEGKGSTFGFKFPIHSKLKIKRMAAPAPSNVGPGIGELAAGIGVPAEALEATQRAGIEAPLPDSADKSDLERQAAEQAKSLEAAADKV